MSIEDAERFLGITTAAEIARDIAEPLANATDAILKLAQDAAREDKPDDQQPS